MPETTQDWITCKAAVAWEAKAKPVVQDICVAPPMMGEVRVKVLSNALCHTDIYTLDGHDPEGLFPCILGHEASAIVESVGLNVTSVKPGDWVIPCYTPQCKEPDCKFCASDQTNMCPKIRAYQGSGVMPDGTSRFRTLEGQTIYHFMGCSTFSEYTVLAEISVARVSPMSNPKQSCLLGCGVATGWGAVENNAKVYPGSSVAVFGLGALGLAVIQRAHMVGAKRITAIDVNTKKFDLAKKMGATETVCSSDKVKEDLMALETWGYDFTFDCTGNVAVMRTALEIASRGWGTSCVIGVAPAGKEIATRPFQLVTGRRWIGTAFGGWKSRDEVPRLVQDVMRNEISLDPYVTHEFSGLDKINDSIEALQAGECIRAVIHIAEPTEQDHSAGTPYSCPSVDTISKTKVMGGSLVRITHESKSVKGKMTLSVFTPPKKERSSPAPPVLVFLGGLTCTDENARTKANVFASAVQNGYAVVFPDTSPRNDVTAPSALGDKGWLCGPGASFYVNATKAPYKDTYQMEDYLVKDLPQLLEDYFDFDLTKMGITGFSMGGHGAITMHIKHPALYKSCSAFAPIATLSDETQFASASEFLFEGGKGEAKQHEAVQLLLNSNPTRAKILVDQGSSDAFLVNSINYAALEAVRSKTRQDLKLRLQPGYGHDFFFVSSFISEHMAHHAATVGHMV